MFMSFSKKLIITSIILVGFVLSSVAAKGYAGVSADKLSPPVGKTATLGHVAKDLKKIGGRSEVAVGPASIIDYEELILPDKQATLGILRNPVPETIIEVVVSDHSSDTDTVVATIAEAQRIKKAAELKGFNNIIVFPVIQGELNDETLFILKEAGIDPAGLIFLAEDNVEDLLTALAEKEGIAKALHLTFNITLTDHSRLKLTGKNKNENLPILKERIIRVIDHHPISGEIKPTEAIYEEVGSTNTLIFERFVKSGVPIPKNAGLLMLSAILSDTKNLTGKTTTDRDKKAAEELRNILGYSEQEQKDLYIRQTDALNTIDVPEPLQKIFNSDHLRYYSKIKQEEPLDFSFTTLGLKFGEENLLKQLWPEILEHIKADMQKGNLEVAFFNLTHLNVEAGLDKSKLEELYVVGSRDNALEYIEAAQVPYVGEIEEVETPFKDTDIHVYKLNHKKGAARKETVNKITDYFSYIQPEDRVYSVSGGGALDNLVKEISEKAHEMLKKPVLKISVEKKSDYVVQVIWQFAGVTIRKNFKFDETAHIDVDEIVREVNIIKSYWEVNNFDLRKEEDYKNACEIITESLAGDELEFVIKRLLPEIKDELSKNKRIQRTENEPRVFLVTPDVFREGGIRNALRKAAELSSVMNIKVAFYGDKTTELNDILGIEKENIITAKNLDELLKELANRNIGPVNTIALIAPEDKDSDDSARLRKLGIRQIVTPGITTLAVAKGIKELFSDFDFVRQGFNEFMSKILIEDRIILPINSGAHMKIIDELKEGVFVFPDQVKPLPEVAKVIKEAIDTEIYKKFVEKFI